MMAMVRRYLRIGPWSPQEVALRIRSNEVEDTGGGWLRLSSETENGVRIEELSNGKQDRLRVTVNRGRIHGDPGDLVAHVELNGKSVTHHARPQMVGENIVFNVPLVGARCGLRITFSEPGPDAIDNYGFGYGVGYRLATASSLVRAQLAARLYERRGQGRSDVSKSARLAVGALPSRRAPRRQPSKLAKSVRGQGPAAIRKALKGMKEQ
jgi:hypothetical protein